MIASKKDKSIRTSVVSELRMLSSRAMEIQLEIEGGPFTYLPGQFIGLRQPAEKNNEVIWQYYSIASAPDNSQKLKLCVNIEQDDSATLINPLIGATKGMAYEIIGPEGVLLLPEQINKKIVMIATGTGVAPFRSMLMHIAGQNVSHSGIHLIYGARTEEDILYKKEFESLEKTINGFKYDTVLSRQGNKGRVRNVYMSAYADARPDVLFYLCGWPDMIRQAIDDLVKQRHFSSEQLIYEIYD